MTTKQNTNNTTTVGKIFDPSIGGSYISGEYRIIPEHFCPELPGNVLGTPILVLYKNKIHVGDFKPTQEDLWESANGQELIYRRGDQLIWDLSIPF